VRYVYIKSEDGLWTVGFYGPGKEWNPESDHKDPKMAAHRVHWLNGGNSEDRGDVDTNAALIAACKAMLRSHAPTINGLCKICHHYGDDCEAHAVRALVVRLPVTFPPAVDPLARMEE
jgi:hypothetical protein